MRGGGVVVWVLGERERKRKKICFLSEKNIILFWEWYM